MAKYVAIYENEQKECLPPDLLQGHVEHLRSLHSRGILFLCGTLKTNETWVGKGLLIFEADSQDEVENCVLNDPFIVHKWYSGYSIYEWVEANESNNYLS